MGAHGWYLTSPGALVQLPVKARWDSERYSRRLERIMHETQRGVRHAYELFERGEWKFNFRIPESLIAQYRAIHEATRGDVLPFYFVPDVDLFDASPVSGALYVRKEKDFDPQFVAPVSWPGDSAYSQFYAYTLKLTEEVPAVEIED